jgi:hypothetical protein
VLCDQLEVPRAIERCVKFVTEVRPESYARAQRAFESECPGACRSTRFASEVLIPG